MNIFDPLYGRFDLPSDLAELAQIPEVRRLSQIRLLNTLTPSLSVLGELRRYSHTLGVLHLAQQSPLTCFSDEEVRAFLASVLLHDIATPPFGHLFEYELDERTAAGWSHERFIKRMLWRFHVPENSAHQIFGRTLCAAETLDRLGISVALVDKIISAAHPLSQLLFGSLDLDNVDNVARMAWALGIGGGAETALRIASGLSVNSEGELVLNHDPFYEDVVKWAYLRRLVYEIIVFDAPTVAAQAVLSEAVQVALDNNLLDLDDWDLYDESLLEKLRQFPETKAYIISDYLGRLPALAFCLRTPTVLAELGFQDRKELATVLKSVLAEVFPREQLFSYVFSDRGTFEKNLLFSDASGQKWGLGLSSKGTVLYGFVRNRDPIPAAKTRALIELLRERLELSDAYPPTALFNLEVMNRNERQIPLPFAAS